MKICKQCGKLAGYNSYFGGYYCTSCGNLEKTSQKYNVSTVYKVRPNVKTEKKKYWRKCSKMCSCIVSKTSK